MSPLRRAGAALLVVLALAGAAAAQEELSHTDPSIGGRAVFYRPKDADHGTWAPGGQVKMRLNNAYALEGSFDVTRHQAAGADYGVKPLQLTLRGYFTPATPLSFYALAGCGWYFTRVGGPGAHSETPFRDHAGAGVELLMGDWSLDASWRYLFSFVWRFDDYGHPWGSGYHEQGSMITLALNRRF